MHGAIKILSNQSIKRFPLKIGMCPCEKNKPSALTFGWMPFDRNCKCILSVDKKFVFDYVREAKVVVIAWQNVNVDFSIVEIYLIQDFDGNIKNLWPE